MRIIAVMSPKGGIGKTTTSDSIAYMLGEEQEKRVLVLDGDPQGDTSKTFGVFEPGGIGMSELLEKHECVGGTYKTGDLIRPTEYSHVDIIPANGYLMKTDMNLLLKEEDNQVTRLREALEEVADAYDYCILKQISKCKINRIICDGKYQVIIFLKDGIRTRSGDRCIVENQIGIQFQMVIATLEPATHQCVRRCCTVRNWRERFTSVILDSVV